MDTSLPSHPDVSTYRYPFAGLHPGTSGHMHGEAPTHPSMDMGPRIGGSVPSPHYRYTDKYTRKDGHMDRHMQKRGGPIGKKRGGPSYGRADRPMDWGVHVVPCMYTWKYTQPSHFGKKWGCLSVLLGGWVEKMGAYLGKKGGATRKNPRPMGENGGGPWREGKNPPGTFGSPWSERGATEPVGTRLGGGMGIHPSNTLPSPYGTLNRFLEALGNILEPLDVHTPLPTHPCVHVEALAYRLHAIDLYRQVRPGCLSWQPETRNSQMEIPLRCARGNYDAHARQPPSRMRGFPYPYHGSSPLGSPIHFGLCHLSQCAMYLDIAIPGGSGRL